VTQTQELALGLNIPGDTKNFLDAEQQDTVTKKCGHL
jgi:hypothetical protein